MNIPEEEILSARAALQVHRTNQKMWRNPDAYLLALIEGLRRDLTEAAISLGLEWNGRWRDSDIQLIAQAYKSQERMRDD